jgi:2-polyprenyl-3-methyl-5-hydroxy-6-metoxy-1,4-benzoquinol methylase
MPVGRIGNMNLIEKLRWSSYRNDLKAFSALLDTNPDANLLDVGCGDGIKTRLFADKIGTRSIHGVDIRAVSTVTFPVLQSNLDTSGLPFRDEAFDVVMSYHVIEHVSNTDLFVSEIHRVLKPSGYVLIGTPNLASGRVILELLMNKQPNTTHVSDFFILRGDPGHEWKKSIGYLHRRLFTAEGMKVLLEKSGLKVEVVIGTGYGPLFFGKWLLRGLYAADIIVKARKV